MNEDDLDIAFLAWSMHRNIDSARMPPGRTVIEFQFSNAPPDGRRFWLVHESGATDMCLKSPGYEIDLQVRADLRLFIEAWRGIRNLRREIQAGRVQLLGARPIAQAVSELADAERTRSASAVASRSRAAFGCGLLSSEE